MFEWPNEEKCSFLQLSDFKISFCGKFRKSIEKM